MKELKHLEDIFENYDTFVIDLWGVMHNGVVLNPKAIEAVDQLKKHSKYRGNAGQFLNILKHCDIIFTVFLESNEMHRILGNNEIPWILWNPMKSMESYGVQWNPQNPTWSNEIQRILRNPMKSIESYGMQWNP